MSFMLDADHLDPAADGQPANALPKMTRYDCMPWKLCSMLHKHHEGSKWRINNVVLCCRRISDQSDKGMVVYDGQSDRCPYF
jgi:hypothetical protein